MQGTTIVFDIKMRKLISIQQFLMLLNQQGKEALKYL